ncbi:hypothetical protein [Novosphingobium resinovorum]|uniref:Uncharacterized protein n=1 Tax=Novosphingobium resinovorum TaxID=158500 RepID=A0A1D8A541_9SPHN|nr:hypothetical protein [Novosphingobium resinovorum]AOR77218.1 hypothetical protein BES08_10995 [Novosphingobium resinovorum]
MSDATHEDMAVLLKLPEFRRFLFAAIQSAGILGHEGPAHGHTPRDLSFAEGRRSLGFDILQLAHRGQPEEVRASDPGALVTLNAAILAAVNISKEKARGKRNNDTRRFDELNEDG